MYEMRAIDEFLGKRVQLVLAYGAEPRSTIVRSYDEFGISIEGEGEYTLKSYVPWSAVREIRLLPDQ